MQRNHHNGEMRRREIFEAESKHRLLEYMQNLQNYTHTFHTLGLLQNRIRSGNQWKHYRNGCAGFIIRSGAQTNDGQSKLQQAFHNVKHKKWYIFPITCFSGN